MKRTDDDICIRRNPGIGIVSGTGWVQSDQTLTKVFQTVAKDGPTCAKASGKSMYFWASSPRFDRTLINLLPDVAKVSLDSEYLWVNWPQFDHTLINQIPDVAKASVPLTHFALNWSRFPETLIKVLAKCVQFSLECKTSWQKESAVSQKATKVAAKTDQSSHGSTGFRAGWPHFGPYFPATYQKAVKASVGLTMFPSTRRASGHVLTQGWPKATQSGQDWSASRQKHLTIQQKAKAAPAKVVKAAQKITHRPMPLGPLGTKPINPNRGVFIFSFMP